MRRRINANRPRARRHYQRVCWVQTILSVPRIVGHRLHLVKGHTAVRVEARRAQGKE